MGWLKLARLTWPQHMVVHNAHMPGHLLQTCLTCQCQSNEEPKDCERHPSYQVISGPIWSYYPLGRDPWQAAQALRGRPELFCHVPRASSYPGNKTSTLFGSVCEQIPDNAKTQTFHPMRSAKAISNDHIIIATFLILNVGQFTLFSFPLFFRILSVFVVILIWICHCLYSIIVHLQAESNALVQRLLRLAGVVQVQLLIGLDKLLVIVDGCIDDTIHNSLCNHSCGILWRFQA